MRTIILALLLLPLITVAQRSDAFLKLTDAAGQLIKGEATLKGYEKNIGILSFSSGGKNNTQLTFSMSVTGASADLKRIMGNNSFLQNGVLNVTQPNGNGNGLPVIAYSIKMENIRVNSCSEVLGCNNAMTTTAQLTATRIGWTYYQTDASGRQTVSRKYGFDADTGREWTNF